MTITVSAFGVAVVALIIVLLTSVIYESVRPREGMWDFPIIGCGIQVCAIVGIVALFLGRWLS